MPQVRTASQTETCEGNYRPRRGRAVFLVRHVLPADSHAFIGRIFDLSIIGLHFKSYEDLAQHADCKYAFDVNEVLSIHVRRVESLNLVGRMLWPEHLPQSFREFPISRYQWLTITADAFLMRYISVVDCALLLTNEVFEIGLVARKCSLDNLCKALPSAGIKQALIQLSESQGALRGERNKRFHHGEERGFTDDDQTFRIAAILEHQSGVVGGTDRYERKVDLERSMKEGLVELQRDFNRATRKLIIQLNGLYSILSGEFERRFVPRFRAASHGLAVNRKHVQK
jgi:hypothetical protein